uniref:Immunoglobulin V-set domain-containing protein n=1 Tax=Spermophilus dauricus TaxID=99837 RepID=A0A8C9PR82_SPEDA
GTVLMGTPSCFPKGLLLSACILALWPPHGSQAALRIQKIPEQPQKNQDLLLSLQGVPDSFQDFTWYRGSEAHGGTMLFTYIPGLQRPQRHGSALGQRDVVGFPNGSMLLRHAQPSDSGTYQVAMAINPAWTMRAKTEVRVAGEWRPPQGSRSWAPLLGRRHQLVPAPSSASGDNNVYEGMPSPVLLATPLGNTGPTSAALVSPLPSPSSSLSPQDLLHPDSSPYCQLMPKS